MCVYDFKFPIIKKPYFSDAHHDKGVSTHTSGARLKDQEGAAHGTKEGERDRGFVKEQKSEEAHDAAYDTKERKFYDGEQHKEELKEENNKATSVGQKEEKQAEVIPVVSGNLEGRPDLDNLPKVFVPVLESNIPEQAYFIKPLSDNAALVNSLYTPAVTPKMFSHTPLDQIRSFKRDLLSLMFPYLTNLYYYN